jgi:ABC-type glycerol-3-phosphate transport system substrate-binding protein
MWSWDRYWYRVEMFGGQPVNPEDRTECLLGSPEAQEALEWARALEWDQQAMLQPLALGTMTDPSMPQWASQKFAMHEDGFYPIETYAAVNEGFRYQYSEVPQGPVSRRVLGTTDAFAMYSGSQNQDAAWELAKFLSGPVYQERQTQTTGLLPGRVSVLDRYQELLLADHPELEAVNLQAGMDAAGGTYAGNRVLFEEDAAAREIIVPALESVYGSGSNPVSYFIEIAEQVTADQRERAGG